MILIIFLSVFSVTGCKVAEIIDKEEISSEEKSEQELDAEAEEDAVIIEETEEIEEWITENRGYNRKEIEAHPMAKRIKKIMGSKIMSRHSGIWSRCSRNS